MTHAESSPAGFQVLDSSRFHIVEVIRMHIRAAREIGRPDPSDDELNLALTAAHVHAVDVLRHFASAKREAIDMLSGRSK